MGSEIPSAQPGFAVSNTTPAPLRVQLRHPGPARPGWALGPPAPTLFHLLPGENVLLLSSSLSPAHAPAAFTRTSPLRRVLLGLLRHRTNPKLLRAGSVKIHLRTAREVNLKTPVSELHTLCLLHGKAVHPSTFKRFAPPSTAGGSQGCARSLCSLLGAQL